MEIFYIIFFFIIGLVLGSFYNVVGFRLSTNGSLINPKYSYCPNCKKTLHAKDLIPILSYIILKGKCRYCGKKISIFYPMVELFTGVLFAVCYYSFGFSYDLLIALLLVSYFSIVIVSDLNYYIIPDQVTITIGILVIIINILKYGFIGSLSYLISGFIMFLFMYLVGIFGSYIFKQEALGGGDIKLMFVLGLTLPLALSFLGVVVSTFLAFPVSLYFTLKNKDKIIPFGPFLISAFLLLFLLKIDINEVYNFFNII